MVKKQPLQALQHLLQTYLILLSIPILYIYFTSYFIVFLILFVIILFCFTICIPMWCKNYSFWIEGGCLVRQVGVFYKTLSIIEFKKVESVTERRGPLQKLFGISTLTLRCAGGVVRLWGVCVEDVLLIKKRLSL